MTTSDGLPDKKMHEHFENMFERYRSYFECLQNFPNGNTTQFRKQQNARIYNHNKGKPAVAVDVAADRDKEAQEDDRPAHQGFFKMGVHQEEGQTDDEPAHPNTPQRLYKMGVHLPRKQGNTSGSKPLRSNINTATKRASKASSKASTAGPALSSRCYVGVNSKRAPSLPQQTRGASSSRPCRCCRRTC